MVGTLAVLAIVAVGVAWACFLHWLAVRYDKRWYEEGR